MSAEGHRGVGRALIALERVVASPEGLSLGELARELDAPKSSLHPLLRALLVRDYLVYDGSRYRVGPAIGTLAAARGPSIVAVAGPLMQDLVDQFDETVMLGGMVGETLVYLHTVESSQMVRYSPPKVRPPTERPSSIGKLYLAQLPEALLERHLQEHTRPEERDGLRQEVVEARTTGLAYNHGETFPDLSAVASAIFGELGLTACLAIGGPTRRIEARRDEMAEALRGAAKLIADGLS
ncbi:DNA-binding IclR family transcriptional regulator [Nocardioides sp. BE266]|uniref:IclR family transcriptional regulator n=1 Tax=Nocardioides sp. BE266 TaxID=2817725 RepID=UPI002867A60E|nr:IclR family transcriptional regulator [Nocardioides sp. BE266]MDR7254198.1 DNA-binding IclR family transcriptional regulator [Nocardioides sp. BE266]